MQFRESEKNGMRLKSCAVVVGGKSWMNCAVYAVGWCPDWAVCEGI